MKEDRLDQWIKEVMRTEAEKIPVPDMSRDLIRVCREESHMRKWNLKKTVTIVAAICMLCAGTVIAGGKIETYLASSSPANEQTSYEKVKDVEQKAGVDGKTVEKFQNGFGFSSVNTVDTKGLDESGNKVTSYQEVSIRYKKGELVVDLYLYPNKESMEQPEGKETKYQDISLFSSSDSYKFVPEGYESTMEEKEKIEKGELYLSEGSNQVENETYTHVEWADGSTKYLLATTAGMTEEELIEMAKELIDNGK